MKVHEYTYCRRCGKKLKDVYSKRIGYGPECIKKVQRSTLMKRLIKK